MENGSVLFLHYIVLDVTSTSSLLESYQIATYLTLDSSSGEVKESAGITCEGSSYCDGYVPIGICSEVYGDEVFTIWNVQIPGERSPVLYTKHNSNLEMEDSFSVNSYWKITNISDGNNTE